MKPASRYFKIVVVDDHPVFREGLVRILNREPDLQVIAEAGDAVEAQRLVRKLKPELVMVDISLDGSNGIDLTKSLRGEFPTIAILVLSMHKETIYAERAMRAGANGYIMKRENGRELLAAVRQVLNKKLYLSQDVTELMLQRRLNSDAPENRPVVDLLSDRELQIYQLIGDGYGTRQIAESLNLSMKTVETHREHIREKLNLNSSFELTQHAIHWARQEDQPSV